MRPVCLQARIQSASQSDTVVEQVKASFLEMPGLILTLPQARRLFHLTVDDADFAIAALLTQGFLKRLGTDRFALSD